MKSRNIHIFNYTINIFSESLLYKRFFFYTKDGMERVSLDISLKDFFLIGVTHYRKLDKNQYQLLLPFFKFYLTIDTKFKKNYTEKEYSCEIFDDHISWAFGTTPFTWDSTIPYWKKGSFYFLDWIFGRMISKTKILEENDMFIIPLPEGNYLCKMTYTKYFKKRLKTNLFNTSHNVVSFEVYGDIPTNKKDNSCKETHYSCVAKTIPEGLSYFMNKIYRERDHYGGLGEWTIQKE